jgi:ParB family chromosome partitioning protein
VPRKPALGRGLRALIPDTPRARAGLAEIPVAQIRPNPHQPRQRFDDVALDELAASIAEHGILQPLLVSEAGEDSYVVVAGERRLRAARRAGLKVVPAVIREHVDEGAQLALALVENLQRRDLTPLEEARAYEQLRLNLGLSQAEIAQRVGVDRSTVANALRLLKLDEDLQVMVESGRLSAGHARALLAVGDPALRRQVAERAADGQLSVREVERVASGQVDGRGAERRSHRRKPALDPNLRAAEDRLTLRLGTTVEIRPRRRGGQIVISCSNGSELMRVFEQLLGEEHGTHQ